MSTRPSYLALLKSWDEALVRSAYHSTSIEDSFLGSSYLPPATVATWRAFEVP